MRKKLEQRWCTIRRYLDSMVCQTKKNQKHETQKIDWQQEVFKCLVEEYMLLVATITREAEDNEPKR